jgi:hypothetical protein
MAENVLSDAEISAISDTSSIWSRRQCARAIEQAVLAKVIAPYDTPMQWRMAERDAEARVREKEREAFVVAAMQHGASREWAWRKADERYPSLRPQTPPPLRLSTGEWHFSESHSHPCHWSCEDIWFTSPHIKTAADADALAAWLRAYGEAK